MHTQHPVGELTCDAQQLWHETCAQWYALFSTGANLSVCIVNTGNLFATINNQSGLVPVNSAVLYLDRKDVKAPKQIVVATLRVGHDLPATSCPGVRGAPQLWTPSTKPLQVMVPLGWGTISQHRRLFWSTWISAAVDPCHADTSGTHG